MALEGGASRVCEGTDGVTKTLADLVMHDRARLDELEPPCAALAHSFVSRSRGYKPRESAVHFLP